MKTYLKLAVFLSLLHTAAYSQFSDFRLDQYKLPDIKTSTLEFRTNYQSQSSNGSLTGPLRDSESRMRNSSGTMSMEFNHLRNRENYQGRTDLLINGYFGRYHDKDLQVSDYKTNRNRYSIQMISENRFYKNKNFLEVSPRVSYNRYKYEYSQSNQGTSVTQSDDRITTESNITIGAGHGRIEPVEDLRLAIYILEELSKAGRLKKTPPDETVINMARVISKIKNERFFDSRLRKIKELQVIDSFMLANDLLTLNDINYFAILDDQWDYAAGPPRPAGFAISGGVDNNLSFIREKEGYNQYPDTKNYQNILNTEAFARVQYYKPLNLRWQLSAVLRSSYGFIKVNDPLNNAYVEENTVSGIFKADAVYTMQYLPNSRTSVSMSIHGIVSDNNGKSTVTGENGQYKLENSTFDLFSTIQVYYYISPRLRAQLSWDYNFGKDHVLGRTNTITDNVYRQRLSEQYLSFSISYSLF